MSTLERTLFCSIALTLVLGSAGCGATPAQPPAHAPSFAKLGERIDVLAVGPEGTVWVAINEIGDIMMTTVSRDIAVARYGGSTPHWTAYTRKDGLPPGNVTAVAVAPDGTAWFGTAGGVARLRENTWTTYTTRHGLAEGHVVGVAVAPDGTVWVAATDGVSRLTGRRWKTYTSRNGVARGEIAHLAAALDGTVWVAATGGISRLADGAWTTYTMADGLPEDDLGRIAVESLAAAGADGSVWVGTRNDGICRWNGDQADTSHGEAWTTYTEEDGLADNLVSAVAVAPDGTVWAGTHSYVNRLAHPTDTTWVTYTETHGLASRGIRSLVVGPDNTAWVTYDGWTYGLSRWNGTRASTGDGIEWTTYTMEDGLPSNAVTSIAVASDGALWVGTEAGTVSRLAEKTWTTWTVGDITGR